MNQPALRKPGKASSQAVRAARRSPLATVSNRGGQKLKFGLSYSKQTTENFLIAVASRGKRHPRFSALPAPRVSRCGPARRGGSRVTLSNRQLPIRIAAKSRCCNKKAISNRQKSASPHAPLPIAIPPASALLPIPQFLLPLASVSANLPTALSPRSHGRPCSARSTTP